MLACELTAATDLRKGIIMRGAVDHPEIRKSRFPSRQIRQRTGCLVQVAMR
jgi:hypothetical protein